MAQELKQTPVSTFVKGLITEASPLTFPENASVDENNCDLKRTGVRGRRKGIEFESGFSLSSFTFPAGTLIHSLTWENISGEAGAEFLVVQVGATLYFYDKSTTPISGNEKSFTVSLATFSAGNGESLSGSRISGDSINGNFIVVSPAIESFFIEYDSDLDTISTTQINPKVRDFEWQGDVAGYDDKVSIALVTDERKYDTYNSGWIDETDSGHEVLFGGSQSYVTTRNAWPPLTHPWFSGKESSGQFNKVNWEQIGGGNSLIGNGRFILDLYSKDRSTASSVPGLATETENARFSATVGYAGRAWFAGLKSAKNGSRVYFTPIVENMSQIGNFYQDADPTAETISDLIDSDGGVVNIPSASNIRALFEWGNSLLVFAENGVWEISGVDGVFKATEFSINRIRGAIGLTNSAALVDAEGIPFWWGPTGIHTINPNTDLTLAAGTTGTSISESTIQTFWEAIPGDQRNSAIGTFDSLNNKIIWLYGNDSLIEFKYNKAILLDLALQAFYPWEFEDESANTNYVVGMAFYSGLGSTETTLNVVSNSGTDNVVSNSGVDNVVATLVAEVTTGTTEIKFLVRDGDTGSLSFATVTNTSFLDWDTEDYTSFAEAAYDFEDDMTTYKHGVYVTAYFNRTESGFTGNETAGYNPIDPSSCLLKAFWDLRIASSSSQQAYRLLVPTIVDTGDLTSFNYPYSSIITRNRIRGKGRNLKLRFESTTGKDFQLQGYEVINAKNQGL